MKKPFVPILCICFAVAATACAKNHSGQALSTPQSRPAAADPPAMSAQAGGGDSPDASGSALPEEPPGQSDTIPLEPSEGPLQSAIRSSAVDKIEGLAQMPEEAAGAVQRYGSQMGWMEANRITHLERYTPIGSGEYFLIVPQYTGSTVRVEALDWQGGNAPRAAATTYYIESTPDDYALLLDTAVPESAPALRVTVSRGELTGTYDFLYDGKGASLPEMQNGIYRTSHRDLTEQRPPASPTDPTAAKTPGFQSGAGTHDRSGVFFVEHDPSAPGKALRVDYVVKLPYAWTKEFKYPDSEYAQYFFTGEYLVRFEGYAWDSSPMTQQLSDPDAAEIVTLGSKTVYLERMRSGDSVYHQYFFAVESESYYVKVVLSPYLHSLDDPARTYTQSLDELDEEVRLMISSFSVTEQTATQRPF